MHTDGATKDLRKDLSLLDLCAINFAADHRTEWDLYAEFLCNCECEGGFASSRRACEEQRTS